MKLTLILLTLMLLATFASATTVDFNSYTPLDTWMSPIVSGGLTFTGSGMAVWTHSPNDNGTPALINFFANDVTITLTGGGAFTLNSVDMTLSWYDNNLSGVITVNGNPITLIQGLQTYNLNLSNVTSVVVSPITVFGYWLMDNVDYNNTNTTTPEPGTLALLGSGMLAGGGVLRRKLML